MRVSVIINSKAGSVDEALIREKIQEALFRCDLRFVSPKNLDELERFAAEEIGVSGYFMICGGDGTINRTLQSLVRMAAGAELPPICLIRSGTANDLAAQLGISRKIEKAARCLLEGGIKKIDLIEIETDTGEKTVMITNGGVGIPAIIAGEANRFRQMLKDSSQNGKLPWAFRFLAKQSDGVVKKMGSGVYMMMVAEALRQWTPMDWEVELELPGREPFATKASCILVNNQPRIGSSMTPAPFTSNTDGLMNVLVTEAHTLKDQLKAVMSLRRGRPHELSLNQSYEVSELRLRSKEGRRPLTFFGDGEILLKDAREIRVRCIHQGLAVVVGQEC
ncbi:MAG: kinase [Bdellovibrionaceae bacterium]|nr:kinase [Pseudobdellovibrionaceae bacterium]